MTADAEARSQVVSFVDGGDVGVRVQLREDERRFMSLLDPFKGFEECFAGEEEPPEVAHDSSPSAVRVSPCANESMRVCAIPSASHVVNPGD